MITHKLYSLKVKIEFFHGFLIFAVCGAAWDAMFTEGIFERLSLGKFHSFYNV